MLRLVRKGSQLRHLISKTGKKMTGGTMGLSLCAALNGANFSGHLMAVITGTYEVREALENGLRTWPSLPP